MPIYAIKIKQVYEVEAEVAVQADSISKATALAEKSIDAITKEDETFYRTSPTTVQKLITNARPVNNIADIANYDEECIPWS